jgi:predicted RNA binding protein YcfA (HicA-like mRNA interferase family)
VPRLPVLGADDLIRALAKAGFYIVRQRGSHVRMEHADGRLVTVPVHSGQDVGRGLLRKILRDPDLTREEFLDLLR